MSKLMEGKRALVLGVANKWSLAYAIAEGQILAGLCGAAHQFRACARTHPIFCIEH